MVLGMDWLRDRVSMLGARITKHPRFDKGADGGGRAPGSFDRPI